VGDLNCHVGAESDLGEYTALLEAALGGEAEGVLVPSYKLQVTEERFSGASEAHLRHLAAQGKA
jgi:hypothetical protein